MVPRRYGLDDIERIVKGLIISGQTVRLDEGSPSDGESVMFWAGYELALDMVLCTFGLAGPGFLDNALTCSHNLALGCRDCHAVSG